MEENEKFSDGSNYPSGEKLWYVDNYILLKDYYDRTISRVSARCIRTGNIPIEDYEHYGYILDVLEEISDTGTYIVEHPELHDYVEKKIAGGMGNLRKTLKEFKTELRNNATPEMIKPDKNELDKMKEALKVEDKAVDPTVGAGMSMDEVINKLMNQNQSASQPEAQSASQTSQANQLQAQQPVAQPTQAQQKPAPQQQRPQPQSGQQPQVQSTSPNNPGAMKPPAFQQVNTANSTPVKNEDNQ